jgi:CheY-like chemotaxis protein/PAS domain-containing protein
MTLAHLLFALLLPIPPYLGFWIYRLKGRVGLSYGYFLGGILGVLAMPWHLALPQAKAFPSGHMGGTLLGFSLFLQAYREGRHGLRRLLFGVGGATAFGLIFCLQLGLDPVPLAWFWGAALLEALIWLLLSDLGYRATRGRWLEARVPLIGGLAFLLATLGLRLFNPQLPLLHWQAAALAGLLLGLVALQQLRWLRANGIWVEGRGDGFRTALSVLESDTRVDAPALAYGIESRQPVLLLNEKGVVLEANGAFGRQVGMARHQLRGYALKDLMQGGSAGAWEDLLGQLNRSGRGSTTATLVRADGSFGDLELQAAAFDKNMALAWVAASAEDPLALPQGHGAFSGDGHPDAQRRLAVVNALGAVLPLAERLLTETKDDHARGLAALLLAACQRLTPTLPLSSDEVADGLDARARLEDLRPKLQRMLPTEVAVLVEAAPLQVRLKPEALERIATHLLLHARQRLRSGVLTIQLSGVDLGGRGWGLLKVKTEGLQAKGESTLLGLGWLQQLLAEGRGMLELGQDRDGLLTPLAYLPLTEPALHVEAEPLKGRLLWLVDQDLLVRETLGGVLRKAGAECVAFADLRELLKASHGGRVADLLILERTPRLERFQGSIRKFQRRPIPTLVMGTGQALPVSPASLGLTRVGFLEKPFPTQELLQSVLAVLHAAEEG